MNIWSKQNLSKAGGLVVALMVANFLNFVFNAFLGRQLSYEQFGLLTFYNTILYIAAILYTAFGYTINHRTAYLNGKYGHEAGTLFAMYTRKWASRAMFGVIAIWILLSPVLGKLFNISDLSSIVLFSPIFLFGMAVNINRGYLQGNLHFGSVALVVLVEPFIKLMMAAALVFLGFKDLVYLSLPASLFAAFVISMFLTSRYSKKIEGRNKFAFPKRFMSAAFVTGISTTAFLSLDVVLVKHFLDPILAGQYSLISLVGKMVFFLGTLLNGFMITFVSHDSGEKVNTKKTFYRLFSAALILVSTGVAAVGLLGKYTVPILLGDKAMPILQYLPEYSIAIALFTLSSVIVTYHLAKEQYSFSGLALAVTIFMGGAIAWSHDSLQSVISAIFWSSLISLVSVSLLHILQSNGRFIFANIVNLLNLFAPLEKQPDLKNKGKRILMMNWRDTKHSMAGGAEVYVHELAKRWVQMGNQVTLFCGNDGKSFNNETIDGVRIIRRGGFYFVYPWAFIYYITRFRGKFDLIVDCQNGVPFFTPLYAKEKVFCILFHVHQDIFFKYLPKPAAWFASVLENRLMPYVYKKVKFLTISESTKKDMEKIDLKGSGIEVIFPGVDLGQMVPGEKNLEPTVLYLGRLKAYKSVDVLIEAFKTVLGKMDNAKLLIAGSGEEEDSLKELVKEMDLKDRIQFLGKVPEHQKVLLMQQAWVFVNPSMMEGWGITTIEANACGTPVIASDVPGLRDSVKNPHTGFLVPHGDSSALAYHIAKLLADNNLRKDMSENAIEWASQYNWNISATKGLSSLT